MEWPPKSGKDQEFPEIDRAAWFPIEEASRKISKGQQAFLVQLKERLGGRYRFSKSDHSPFEEP